MVGPGFGGGDMWGGQSLLLKLLDVETWGWRAVRAPGIAVEIRDNIVVLDRQLVLLIERSTADFKLQALGLSWVWHSVAFPADYYGYDVPYLVTIDFAVYDHGRWKRLLRPPTSIFEARSEIELDDRIVLMSATGSCTLKQYVFSKPDWEILPEMQHLRAGTVVVLWKHMLVVLGGH